MVGSGVGLPHNREQAVWWALAPGAVETARACSGTQQTVRAASDHLSATAAKPVFFKIKHEC